MGASDQTNEGTWLWDDNSAVDLTSPIWNCGEPKDSSSYNCASLREETIAINHLDTKRHRLYNSQCSSIMYFICQLRNETLSH